MFGNLNRVNVPKEHLRGAVLVADAKQGQWGFISGTDSDTGDPEVDVVDSYADAQSERQLLGVIQWEPISNEDVTDVIADKVISSGTRILFMQGKEAYFEQLNLDDTVDADFSAASHADKMVITASGWPTLDGASDDPGASATVVAYFENIKGKAVTYRTS